MKRSKSSEKWLREHHSDRFVLQARQEGYRSRAVYKLKEVDQQYHLIQPGIVVLELGAAPGGWTQYVVEKLKGRGRVLAVDCLAMPEVPGAEVVQGDFTIEAVQEQILAMLGEQRVNVLLSDLSPNLSGVKAVDGLRTCALSETVLEVMDVFLKPGAHLFMKVFHGPGFESLMKQLRQQFESVKVRKPEASRSQSSETYVLAQGYKGTAP